MRELIVNADDCNLTAGVTRAILESYAQGIVSSTSWMVNLPFDGDLKAEVALSGVGVGLHLNVTFGKPVSRPTDIVSLKDEEGLFRKRATYAQRPPSPGDLVKEYSKQITLFQKIFGRLPTHLDTHHQMHNEPVFMQALAHVAREHKLPVRRSALMNSPDFERRFNRLKTTQVMLGDLSPHAFWTGEKFERAMAGLLPGTAELMCHPGIWDEELQKVTTMTVTREKEFALFSSPHLKKVLEKHKIRLINFSNL